MSVASRNCTIVFRTITRMSSTRGVVRVCLSISEPSTPSTRYSQRGLVRQRQLPFLPSVDCHESMIAVERFPGRRGSSMFSRAVLLHPRHDLRNSHTIPRAPLRRGKNRCVAVMAATSRARAFLQLFDHFERTASSLSLSKQHCQSFPAH